MSILILTRSDQDKQKQGLIICSVYLCTVYSVSSKVPAIRVSNFYFQKCLKMKNYKRKIIW